MTKVESLWSDIADELDITDVATRRTPTSSLQTAAVVRAKRPRDRLRRKRLPSKSYPVIGLSFNQLTAYLFAFSVIRLDRIVNQDCTKRWYQ